VDELKEARADVSKAGFRALNSLVAPAVQAGLANPLPVGSGAVILETIGRKSGLARRVPLLASRLGDRIVVSTVRNDSQWLKNVEANPDVTVWLGGRAKPATACVSRGPLNVAVLTLS
jgi:hypothetical protein